MSNEVVWQATVDDGEWEVQVTRDAEYTGTLVVTHATDREEILRQSVALAYGAVFGPDVSDVAEWQKVSLDAIDQRNPEAGP